MKFVGIIILFFCTGFLYASAGLPAYIVLRANPEVIKADGVSSSTIIAEVMDYYRQPVPDNIEVQFEATLGYLSQDKVSTTGGRAITTLKSTPQQPGIAIVTATALPSGAGGVSSIIEVEMVAEYSNSYRESRNIVLGGDYLAYSVEHKIITATGRVTLRYKSLRISANHLQLDLIQDIMMAQGKIEISNAKTKLCGDNLWFDLRTQTGSLIRAKGEAAEQLIFNSESLTLLPNNEYKFDFFQPLSYEDTKTWIVGERMEVFPHEKIHIRHATIFIEDVKILTVPYYVIQIEGITTNPLTQQFGLSSDGGLSLNLPFYYLAKQNHTAALRLRHNSLIAAASSGSLYSSIGGSSVQQQGGFSIDLEHQYAVGRGMEGLLLLEQVNRAGDQLSLRWQHFQEFDYSSRAFLYLDYNNSALYSRINYYKRFKAQDLSYDLLCTKFAASGNNHPINYSSGVSWRLRHQKIEPLQLSYSLGANLRLERLSYSSPKTNLKKELQLELLPADIPLDNKSRLASFFWARLSQGSDNSRQLFVSSSWQLRRKLTKDINLGLSYSYDFYDNNQLLTIGSSNNTSSRLGLNLYGGRSSEWFGYLWVGKQLSAANSFSLYGRITYRLKGDLNRFRIGWMPLYQKYNDRSYDSSELLLAYELFGSQDILLRWQLSKNKLRLELANGWF